MVHLDRAGEVAEWKIRSEAQPSHANCWQQCVLVIWVGVAEDVESERAKTWRINLIVLFQCNRTETLGHRRRPTLRRLSVCNSWYGRFPRNINCCFSFPVAKIGSLYVARYAEQARVRQEARQAKKGEEIGEDEAAKAGAQMHPPRFLVLKVKEFRSSPTR